MRGSVGAGMTCGAHGGRGSGPLRFFMHDTVFRERAAEISRRLCLPKGKVSKGRSRWVQRKTPVTPRQDSSPSQEPFAWL